VIKAKFSDAFELQMGKTPSRNNPEYWNGNNKWISISDLGNSNKFISETKECISDKGVKESKIKIVPKGTVIMSFKLSIGKTAITAEDMYTNEAIMAFIDKKKYDIDKNYLYYLLSGYNWLDGTNKAVLGLTLNKATLSQKKILIFPIEEQQKIATVLDKVSNLIALRKKQLEKLEELVKARFGEMFGDPVYTNNKYKKVPLGSVAEVGSSKRIFEKEYVSEGVPFYRTKEIVELSKGNKISTQLFITQKRFDELRHTYGVPKKNDLLISAVGTIGVIWIVDGKNDFYFKDGNLLKVSPSSIFNSIYLKMVLESLINSYKLEMSTGTAYAALTISALKQMKIYIVPYNEQEKFANFVTKVDKQKLTIQKSLDKLEILKKALMQEYFG